MTDIQDEEGAVNTGSNLFVTGIAPSLTETTLSALFERYGEVENCSIMVDPHTKESRGFGFVKMTTSEQADAAKEALQGETHDGRTLSIEKARRARPRTPTPGKYFGPPKRGKIFRPYSSYTDTSQAITAVLLVVDIVTATTTVVVGMAVATAVAMIVDLLEATMNTTDAATAAVVTDATVMMATAEVASIATRAVDAVAMTTMAAVMVVTVVALRVIMVLLVASVAVVAAVVAMAATTVKIVAMAVLAMPLVTLLLVTTATAAVAAVVVVTILAKTVATLASGRYHTMTVLKQKAPVVPMAVWGHKGVY